MVASMVEPKTVQTSDTSDARWQAVVDRDARADGTFVYAVKTTGVYCRPSCGARLPRHENVTFHDSPAAAECEGFRACKRCKPNEQDGPAVHADLIGRACITIRESANVPALAMLAAEAGLSPSHFHRLFKSAIGLTPKAYATANRAEHVRTLMKQRGSITAAIYSAGFNSNGRFYETSSATLGMTPTAFRAGGEGATIRFAVGRCSLGEILVAATNVGICAITLGNDPAALLRDLQDRFPRATLVGDDKSFGEQVAEVIAFVERPATKLRLPLHLQGTAFQHRVWRALIDIPSGETRSYSAIATAIGEPKSTRAVARACASNAIAVAIPCHRVVRTDGSLSGYRWGVARKLKLLERERR